MASTPASFRISLHTGEIEIHGSEEFVEQHLEGIEGLLDLIRSSGYKPRALTPSKDPNSEESAVRSDSGEMPDSFGEWENGFPKDINGTDRALVAGYFAQKQSADNDFKTIEVNRLLQQHGHKLSNTSQAMKNLEERKQIFRTRKKGTISYFRVARTGEDHLNSLRQKTS